MHGGKQSHSPTILATGETNAHCNTARRPRAALPTLHRSRMQSSWMDSTTRVRPVRVPLVPQAASPEAVSWFILFLLYFYYFIIRHPLYTRKRMKLPRFVSWEAAVGHPEHNNGTGLTAHLALPCHMRFPPSRHSAPSPCPNCCPRYISSNRPFAV